MDKDNIKNNIEIDTPSHWRGWGEAFLHSDRILVHTSGSTGEPKPLWVETRRMRASARITCDFLGLRKGDTALLCLPLDYIAGKMVVVRALERGLRLIEVPPTGHPLATLQEAPVFAAMVPLQVYNSLRDDHDRLLLREIRQLIIGGGAIDDDLQQQLRNFPNAIWSTYGMTETLSHIALRRLSGSEASEWYTPFQGVQVSLSEEGCLVIDAPEVCAETLTTNDIAELAPDGHRFRILGRRDNVIDSGGVKIQIEEVERRLQPLLSFPCMITRAKDRKFGEIVVLLFEGKEHEAEARKVCTEQLPKYWQPRAYIAVDSLPTTATGKPARKEAERLAERASLLGANSETP